MYINLYIHVSYRSTCEYKEKKIDIKIINGNYFKMYHLL